MKYNFVKLALAGIVATMVLSAPVFAQDHPDHGHKHGHHHAKGHHKHGHKNHQ